MCHSSGIAVAVWRDAVLQLLSARELLTNYYKIINGELVGVVEFIQIWHEGGM